MPKVEYHHPFYSDTGIVYSCDNVRIEFKVDATREDDFNAILLTLDPRITLYPLSTQEFKYRQLAKFQLTADGAVALGYGFNGTNPQTDRYIGFLDFNPNKVCQSDDFRSLRADLRRCCNLWQIVRVDIAVDLPIPRNLVVIRKDQRKYTVEAYSADNRTEYLGLRSHVGRVKVYNKQLESKLDYPLTRLELTCEPTVDSFIKCCPVVYSLPAAPQLDFDYMRLSGTDRTLLAMEWELLSRGLDGGLMYFQQLGRKKREKLRPFLLPESSLVGVMSPAVVELMADITSTY